MITAAVDHALDVDGRPRFDVVGPERMNVRSDPVAVDVRERRPSSDAFDLDVNGFRLFRHRSAVGFVPARRFIAEGMKAVIADIEDKALDAAVAGLGADGAQVLGVRTDVSRPKDLEAPAQATLDRFGGVHVVCDNAGVESGGPFLEIPPSAWEENALDPSVTAGQVVDAILNQRFFVLTAK